MKHDAMHDAELTHFEECACHALADAHKAIQMLGTRLAEKGILNAVEVESLRALTEHDLESIRDVERNPVAAHFTGSEDSEIAALMIEDCSIHFGLSPTIDLRCSIPPAGRP